jgi:hypothetical protein
MSGDGEVDNQVFQVDLIVGFERELIINYAAAAGLAE